MGWLGKSAVLRRWERAQLWWEPLLALTSITLNTGAGLAGRALARNGAVTLDSDQVSFCSGGNGLPGLPPPFSTTQNVNNVPAVSLPMLAGLAILLAGLGWLHVRNSQARATVRPTRFVIIFAGCLLVAFGILLTAPIQSLDVQVFAGAGASLHPGSWWPAVAMPRAMVRPCSHQVALAWQCATAAMV